MRREGIQAAILLQLVAIAAATAAPLCQVKGTVRAPDGSPVPEAVVGLAWAPAGERAVPIRRLTDAKGGFLFAGVDASLSCTITAEMSGYATVVVGPLVLKPGVTSV